MSSKNVWADSVKTVRDINQKINEFGVSDYQRLKLIELLSLELEDREAILNVRNAILPLINKHEELYALGKEDAKQRYFDSVE
jgi:hypothetical protein